MASGTPNERFDMKWFPEPNTDCWLWVAQTDRKGYGRFWLLDRLVGAPRFAYERWIGPIPRGLTIDHLCNTPSCVNPRHLDVTSRAENVKRAWRAGAYNHLKVRGWFTLVD